MKTLFIFIAAAILGVLVWLGIHFVVFNYRGAHASFGARQALVWMQWNLDLSMPSGSPPDEVTFNRQIQEAWEHAKRNEKYEPPDESPTNDGYWALEDLSDNMSDFLWDKPPVYVVDEKLPRGTGFYLEGEDGISKTRGNDPDDVNSWDKRSYQFYIIRHHRREQMIAVLYALGASVAFLAIALPIRYNSKARPA